MEAKKGKKAGNAGNAKNTPTGSGNQASGGRAMKLSGRIKTNDMSAGTVTSPTSKELNNFSDDAGQNKTIESLDDDDFL